MPIKITEVKKALSLRDSALAVMQTCQHSIRAKQQEASKVFTLAQQPPSVKGAAQARIDLTTIEIGLAALNKGLPELQTAFAQTQAGLREPGLQLSKATRDEMAEIETEIRKVLPQVQKLLDTTGLLDQCNAPLLNGRHDEYLSFVTFLYEFVRQMKFIDIQRSKLRAQERQAKEQAKTTKKRLFA